MKKIRLFTSCAIAVTFASCIGMKQVTKIKEPVEIGCEAAYGYADGENVYVEMDIRVPKKYRNLNTGLIVVPTLQSKDGTKNIALDNYVIEGSFHTTFNARQNIYRPAYADSVLRRYTFARKGATDIAHADTVRYESWMTDSRLHIDVYADAYLKRKPLFSADYPVMLTDVLNCIDGNFREKYYYTDTRAEGFPITGGKGTGCLWATVFPLASDKVSDQSLAASVEKYLKEVKSAFEHEDYSITVVVSNSPEGSVSYNEELGERRVAAVREMLRQAGADMEKCSFSVVTEDWEGVKTALAGGGYEYAQAITDAIANISDPDERENYIRDLYYSDWRTLCREVYPRLRACMLKVIPETKGKEGSVRVHGEEVLRDEQGRQTFSFTPGSLVLAEAMNDSLNARMIDCVKDGDYQAAARIADHISNDGLSQIVRSNKAMIYLKTGEEKKAAALFKRCPDVPQARYNLGLLYLKARKYKEAEPLLEETDNLNKAVVKTALGKREEAREVLSLLPDSQKKTILTGILNEQSKEINQ